MQDSAQHQSTPRVAMHGIRKSFGGVAVLRGVDFTLEAGEVHALLGENGAGKSTLMKILSGVYQADSGSIAIDGEEQQLRGAGSAGAAGIAIIHQELSYIPRLTVAENIYLGRLPQHRPGLVRWSRLFADAQQALAAFGSSIDAHTRMSDLPLGQRQIVEIVRAVRGRARIIVMDEPTASLTEAEVGLLFTVIRALQRTNTSIVYISHHLDEVFQIADRVTVLRDGQRVTTRPVAGSTRQDLVQAMVGRNVADLYQRTTAHAESAALLEARDLSVGRQAHEISFTLHRGEVLGLYGLTGAGQEAVARALFGLRAATGGSLRLDGLPLRLDNPAQAIAAGIGFVPADRKTEGLVLTMSVKHNLTLPLFDRVSRAGILAGAREARLAQHIEQAVRIRAASLNQRVAQLSGGNQQKVVLGRWLARGVKVLILNEPTRGVDVGAKAEIYAAIRDLAVGGTGIVLVSSDLPEMLSITDRVAVIVRGRLARVLDSRQSTQNDILHYATAGRGNGDDA